MYVVTEAFLMVNQLDILAGTFLLFGAVVVIGKQLVKTRNEG
jgi:hypothetical protein